MPPSRCFFCCDQVTCNLCGAVINRSSNTAYRVFMQPLPPGIMGCSWLIYSVQTFQRPRIAGRAMPSPPGRNMGTGSKQGICTSGWCTYNGTLSLAFAGLHPLVQEARDPVRITHESRALLSPWRDTSHQPSPRRRSLQRRGFLPCASGISQTRQLSRGPVLCSPLCVPRAIQQSMRMPISHESLHENLRWVAAQVSLRLVGRPFSNNSVLYLRVEVSWTRQEAET